MGLSATGHGRLEEGRTFVAQARLQRAGLDPIVARIAPAVRGRVAGIVVRARGGRGSPVAAGRDPDDGVDHPGRARRRGWSLDDSLAGSRPLGPRAAHGGPVPGRRPAGDDHGIRRHGSRRERRPHRARAGAGTAAAAARPGHPGRGAGRRRGSPGTGLEAVSIRGRWPVGTVSLDGRVPFEGPIALRSRLMADGAELARTLGQDRVAGQAIVSADVSGSWREPVASGRIEATALTSAEVTLTGVTVPFRLTPSTIRIADARAVLGKDPLALEGEASWPTGGWRGRGTLTAPVLTVGGWPIEALHAAFAVDAERLEATAVSTRVRGVAVRGTGSWQWSGGGRLEARLGPAGLADSTSSPRPSALPARRRGASRPCSSLSRTSPPRWRSGSTGSAPRARRSAPGPWRPSSEGVRSAPSLASPSVASAPLPRAVPRRVPR